MYGLLQIVGSTDMEEDDDDTERCDFLYENPATPTERMEVDEDTGKFLKKKGV